MTTAFGSLIQVTGQLTNITVAAALLEPQRGAHPSQAKEFTDQELMKMRDGFKTRFIKAEGLKGKEKHQAFDKLAEDISNLLQDISQYDRFKGQILLRDLGKNADHSMIKFSDVISGNSTGKSTPSLPEIKDQKAYEELMTFLKDNTSKYASKIKDRVYLVQNYTGDIVLKLAKLMEGAFGTEKTGFSQAKEQKLYGMHGKPLLDYMLRLRLENVL